MKPEKTWKKYAPSLDKGLSEEKLIESEWNRADAFIEEIQRKVNKIAELVAAANLGDKYAMQVLMPMIIVTFEMMRPAYQKYYYKSLKTAELVLECAKECRQDIKYFLNTQGYDYYDISKDLKVQTYIEAINAMFRMLNKMTDDLGFGVKMKVHLSEKERIERALLE